MPSDDERLTNQADCQALSGAPGVVAGKMFGMPTLKVAARRSPVSTVTG